MGFYSIATKPILLISAGAAHADCASEFADARPNRQAFIDLGDLDGIEEIDDPNSEDEA